MITRVRLTDSLPQVKIKIDGRQSRLLRVVIWKPCKHLRISLSLLYPAFCALQDAEMLVVQQTFLLESVCYFSFDTHYQTSVIWMWDVRVKSKFLCSVFLQWFHLLCHRRSGAAIQTGICSCRYTPRRPSSAAFHTEHFQSTIHLSFLRELAQYSANVVELCCRHDCTWSSTIWHVICWYGPVSGHRRMRIWNNNTAWFNATFTTRFIFEREIHTEASFVVFWYLRIHKPG